MGENMNWAQFIEAGPYAMVIGAIAIIQGGVLAIKAKKARIWLQVACSVVQLIAAVLWLASIYL